jgi:diguanylate cyclase (GGDEF)-like protein
MVKSISRLIGYNIKRRFANGNQLAGDFEIIKDAFVIDFQKAKSEFDLTTQLHIIFLHLGKRIGPNLQFFTTNDAENWGESIVNSPYASTLISKSDLLFQKQIQLNTLGSLTNGSKDDSAAFISFILDDKTYCLLEIRDSKWVEVYALHLTSLLSHFILAVKTLHEKSKLQIEVEKANRTLLEKEKALQIAEKAVKRKVYDLHNLVEASNDIYSILNFRQLINSALLTVIGQVGVQSAFVIMYDQSKRSYSLFFQKGFKSKEVQKLKFKVDSPLVKYFTKHNTPVYVDDLARMDEFKTYVQKLRDLDIFIIAPIIFTARVQGIIATRGKHYSSEFSRTDFELFHVLVNIISISIENAQHYEEIRNLSLTDEMTKLHNYRSFKSRLKEEVNRAKRNHSKVSLVILDIDHFKNYNDTLGHQAGDEALREVGKVLRKTVRDEDIVSRYGGEEFCIIFPGIGKEETVNLGERIRLKIESHKFYKEKVQPGGKLTISLGGATYPDDASENHGLIQKADEALYKAKHLGRNQMQIFGKTGGSS